jgi:hypothetical protein
MDIETTLFDIDTIDWSTIVANPYNGNHSLTLMITTIDGALITLNLNSEKRHLLAQLHPLFNQNDHER